MADKDTRLSITLRAIDKATAPIRAFNAKIAAMVSSLHERMKKLATPAGLLAGFKAVGGAITGLIGKLPVLGGLLAGLAGGAVAGLLHISSEFDELGDRAEAAGVSVEWLGQMRYAAKKSGASVEELDAGLMNLSKGLGQARAGTGRLIGQVGKMSPALLKQLVAAKSNEEAFDLVADAMNKLSDPAKKAALAQATLGDASLAPLLARNSAGLQQLRDRAAGLLGPQKEAADAAGALDDAMIDLDASVDGVKASLVKGLSPALKTIVERLTEWLSGHRADIERWAKDFGERLPGIAQSVADWFSSLPDKFRAAWAVISPIVDKILAAIDAVGTLTQSVGIEDITSELRGRAEKAQNGGRFLTPQDIVQRELAKGPRQTIGSDEGTFAAAQPAAQQKSVQDLAARMRDKLQARPDVSAKARQLANGSGSRTADAKAIAAEVASKTDVTLTFNNVPRGMVKIDTKSNLPGHLETNVGYATGGR